MIKSLLLGALILSLAPQGQAQTGTQTVYTDALQNGWQDYSWATHDLACTSPVHGGADSVSVDVGAYTALYFHNAVMSGANFSNLTFWINGGAGGQRLQVQATLNGNPLSGSYALGPLTANAWQPITISLTSLGVSGSSSFDGFWIQDVTNGTQPRFYVDDVSLGTVTVTQSAATVTIDANANRHAISPLIYGVSYGDQALLAGMNSPLNRWGGNATTRYNWQNNATNHAADFYYESILGSSAIPGGDADAFITDSRAGGAQPMMTIPIIGWVAKLGPQNGKLASFSVAKYGAQKSTDVLYMPDAGNGILTNGQYITGNDPLDANQTADAAFQLGWVSHLLGKWGTAATGGVKYYFMDNEPSIWHSSHRDVHPNGETLDEIKADTLAYAAMVKTADPSALVAGPEEWGWSGYLYSGADQQYSAAHNYNGVFPDRAAHGNMDYVPWLLDQMHKNDQATGRRLLDICSIHFYPQGDTAGDQEFSADTSPATQLLRNRSTRNLWDPSYTAENWINQPVKLIPRLKDWVNTYYPGTKTAITEYNWGPDDHISGATAQADILGIFGREGLDIANRWEAPLINTLVYNAFKMYRNYDGNKSTFGDISVSDSTPSPDTLSSFAAVRASDGALTVTVISKILSGNTPVTLTLANFSAGSAAQTWQLTSQNAITHLADTAVSSGTLTATVPAQSITLFVIPAAAGARIVSGVVTLQGRTNMAQPLTMSLTPTGSTTGSVITQTVTPAENGAFTLTNIPAGTYTLRVKGAVWLRKNLAVDVTAGNVSGLTTTLLAGDVNGDNKVDAVDYTLVRQSYGVSGWNLSADVNGDTQVSGPDLLMVRANIGKTGDQ